MKRIFQYLMPVDWLIFIYTLITGIYILSFSGTYNGSINHICIRLFILVIIAFIIIVNNKTQTSFSRFIRYLYPLATLIYFYPEIDFLDSFIFESFDSLLVNIEEILFQAQPSLIFYEKVPYVWFNELMFASYFAYYPLIIFV